MPTPHVVFPFRCLVDGRYWCLTANSYPVSRVRAWRCYVSLTHQGDWPLTYTNKTLGMRSTNIFCDTVAYVKYLGWCNTRFLGPFNILQAYRGLTCGWVPLQAQALPMAHLFSLPGARPRTPANPITLFYAKSLFLVQFLQNRMPRLCGPRALHSLGTSKVIIIISGG